ncbi:MAG: FadR/GntR family transcriptional regulator [Clostridia bacterium]
MTLVGKATNSIHQMILNKEYNANGFLPCEGDLCEILQVSRSTIREAVKEMEVRGYIRRIHGKGILVTDNSVAALEQTFSDVMLVESCSLDDLIELRMSIECSAVQKACGKASVEDLDRMKQCVEKMQNATVIDDAYIQADLSFHIAMVDASKNNFFSTIVKAYQPLIEDTVKAASICDYVIEKKHHYHRDIFQAICNHDSQKAVKCMRVHLLATEENTHNH